jgi:hypothetical protein
MQIQVFWNISLWRLVNIYAWTHYYIPGDLSTEFICLHGSVRWELKDISDNLALPVEAGGT